jgi:hypothetical protein
VHRSFDARHRAFVLVHVLIVLVLALGMAGIDRGQLLVRGLELMQPLHASACLAAVQPLQGDQLLLLANGAARFADHQLEDRAQARIVQSVDQPVEIGAQLGGARVRQAGVGLFDSQSNAVHR